MAEANYSIKASIEANTKKFKSALDTAKRTAEKFKGTMEKIKNNKIDADASGVKSAVESAKASLESFDNTKADAELDVDFSKVREEVNTAKGIVNSFDHLHADAELTADIKSARTNIEFLETYIDRVDNKDADVDISADVSDALSRIRLLQTNLATLTNRHYSAELDADATRAREAIKRAKVELNEFAKQRAKAKLDVDMGAAVSKIEAFKAMLRSIPNIVRTRLIVDKEKAVGGLKAFRKGLEGANNTMDAVANDIRTFSTVIGNMFKGALLSNITLLVPAIASLVPALMAVMNAAGVVAGGALGMAQAFGTAYAGVGLFAGMAVSALDMLKKGTLEATAETQRYQSSLDSLKSAWEGIIKQNQAQIFNTLANGIETAKVALKGLTPFISGVSKGMEQASAKLLDWAKNSQVAQKFFEMMGTTGVRIFNNMLNAAGQFGSGIISVLTQLAPLAEWVSAGFKKMGAAFNQWAQSTEGQNAIKSFIEYTKQNLPLIGQIFGSVFKGIFNLMKAFAPNTHLILESLAQMASQFEQWSATVAK